MAPAWDNEILADGFAQFADGHIQSDATLHLIIDLGTHTIEGVVTIHAEDTLNNSGLMSLVEDIQNAINATEFRVIESISGNPAMGSTQNITVDDLKVRLSDGRIMLTSWYDVTLLSDSEASLLGFNLVEDIASYRTYTIDASKTGSIVNVGQADAPNGEIYIAGNIRAHSAINLYSGLKEDGSQNFNLRPTGVLETLSGSIELNPGDVGELLGDIIARGEGSDIIIHSKDELHLKGNLIAQDDIVITAGSVVDPIQASITTYGTAHFTTLESGGTVSITGLNSVVINNSIGEAVDGEGGNLGMLSIEATHGTLSLEKLSGRLITASELSLKGYSIDIAGVIEHGLVTTDLNDNELILDATHDLILHGDLTLAGSAWLKAAHDIEIYNTSLILEDAQHLLIDAGNALYLGTTLPIAGNSDSMAVVLEADSLVGITTGGAASYWIRCTNSLSWRAECDGY